MSQNHWDCSKENNPMYGVHRYGKDNPSARKIAQYDQEGNFICAWDYIKQASQELHIDNSSISKVCRGKLKYAGGFVWKYI